MIETVIIYKLHRLSREEVQTRLQVHDIRQTRVYQEAKEEGKLEGKEEGRKEGIALAIVRMAAEKMSAKKIASILKVDMELVRQTIAGAGKE